MLGRGRRVISLAGFGAVVDKLPFKTTMSFGLSCGMMGGLFYAGMSTSHHFSAVFRPLCAVLPPFVRAARPPGDKAE